MQIVKIWIYCVLIFFSAGEVCFATEDIFIRDEVRSMPDFLGVMEGKTVGQEGSSYIKMTENEKVFFSNALYPKYYPVYGSTVIGGGHWIEGKINSKKNMPELIQYKFYCGKNILCFVVESDIFYWMVTLSDRGIFIDALPIYGWQSEWEGSGFSRKHIRAMALESDIFAKSEQLLPDIDAYTPQTITKFAFGISDAHLLCSHFTETSYVPYEHTAYEQTRAYRLKPDGHFEIIQEGSCVLSDEKIAEMGLTNFAKSSKHRH